MDIVKKLRGFAKLWLSIKTNSEIIHGVNGFELTTNDLTDAAAEIENLRERNETLQAEVERLRRQLVMG